MPHLVRLLPCVLALAACASDPWRDPPCDRMLVWSVTVEVHTADDAAPEGLAGTYTVSDEPARPCDVLTVDTLACGLDRSGFFVVRVEADGYEPAVVTVDVWHPVDACHVTPERVTAVLDPL